MHSIPKLTLVGAGPGDPDLITIKGVKALQQANVVLYDSLVDPELLHYAPDAEHILVGKRAGGHSVSQETIHHLIVEKAHKKGHVVRLKGGDPFVFARGFEELKYARAHGLETDVVIGISSIMLPGMYGIPLTTRGVNQSFSVVTATTSTGELSEDVHVAAQSSACTLFFMGLNKLDLIARSYQDQGRGDLPVAIISNGSLQHDQVINGTVSTILDVVKSHKIPAPALLIFGEGSAWAQSRINERDWLQKQVVA